MGEELAAIECEPVVLAEAIGTAALDADGHEPHEEMFVRIDSKGVTTPASGIDAQQSSFCTLHRSLFDDFTVFESTAALFPVAAALDWLAYFEQSDSFTVSFFGEPGAELASGIWLEGDHREVRIDCVDAPALLEEVEIWLPDRFEGTQFLTDEGKPVATAVETTVADLDSVIGAVSRCQGVERYPLAVSSDGIQFEVHGERTTVTGTVTGTVDGPGFDRQFGPNFAQIIRAIDGAVTLQTGPEEPLAVVCTDPGVTYRFVLASA